METWQEKLLIDIKSGGMKPGEMTIMMSGRQQGKSVAAAYQRLYNDIFNHGPLTDIKLSWGKVYGEDYWTAEPVGGNWFEMEAWCHETFGPISGSIWGDPPQKASQRWYMNNRKFWFRDEADRMMFVLKWR